jgi:hypothetical protein
LWLGPDYLLQVSSGYIGERYLRWYLREIRGFVARTSAKRLGWNIVWGTLAAFSLGGLALFSSLAADASVEAVRTIFLTLAGISTAFIVVFGTMILVNSALGPTCSVFVQTATGLQPMLAITRERAFFSITAALEPKITEAQIVERHPATGSGP